MNPRWEYRIMLISVHSSNESAKIGEIGWRDISLNITLIRWARLSAQFANAKRVDCGIWAPNWTNWWSHQRANLSTDRPTQRWLSGVVLWTFLTGCINLAPSDKISAYSQNPRDLPIVINLIRISLVGRRELNEPASDDEEGRLFK